MQKIRLFQKNIFPEHFQLHSEFHQKLRITLNELGYQETWCPPLSTSPCFETHVHPFEIFSCRDSKNAHLYLHTSPEFVLKNYLCQIASTTQTGIFNLNYVFRDDRPGAIHRRQFIMLEFYRTSAPVEKLIEDLTCLILSAATMVAEKYEVIPLPNIERITVDELFQERLKFSILDYLDEYSLYEKIQKDFPQNAPSRILPWDDLYNILWLNYIEPTLSHFPGVFIENFPVHLGLLAKVNDNDHRISQRFELFIKGQEIANGYSEEVNYDQNLVAIEHHLQQKRAIYQYQIPKPEFFLNSLKTKGMKKSYGVAVGTERLLQTLTGLNSAFIDIE